MEDVLKPDDEILSTLATELGLLSIVTVTETSTKGAEKPAEAAAPSKEIPAI